MNVKRNSAVDNLRGFAIIGMVFFTLILQLARNLPDILTHNVPGEFHIGDLVFSLFIFASGISSAYFITKRKNNLKLFILDSIEHLGFLLLVAFLLSPFSVGSFFGLDELMLITIMFAFSLFLFHLPNNSYLLLSIIIFDGYYIYTDNYGTSPFDQAYLGGYPGLIFYLPLSSAGLALGKDLIAKKGIKNVAMISFLALILLFIFPIDKMRVSPSFMVVSAIAGIVLYVLLDKIKLAALEYLGRNSIRYWILLFAFFLIPMSFYYMAKGQYTLRIFDWPISILISFGYLLLFFGISKIIDIFFIRS